MGPINHSNLNCGPYQPVTPKSQALINDHYQFPRLQLVHQLLSAAFNIAWACSRFQSAPPACPLSTANFVKSKLNRPWKGGTDGYILGGNYQPLPPDTHREKKETSEGVAFRSTAAADALLRSLARGSTVTDMEERAFWSRDSPPTGSKVKYSDKRRISGSSAQQLRWGSLLKHNSSLQENVLGLLFFLLIKDDLTECRILFNGSFFKHFNCFSSGFSPTASTIDKQ